MKGERKEDFIFKALVLCLTSSGIGMVIQIVLVLNDFFLWFEDEELWRIAVLIWSITSNLMLGAAASMLLKELRAL